MSRRNGRRSRDDSFKHNGSYWNYDHSDQELYVYDQCCQNCRYCGDGYECENYDRENYMPRPHSNWCMDWKGSGS